MPRDVWFWAWRPCNSSSRNAREKPLPTWWAWLSDSHSKCGIYGFLHFFSSWCTSRGGCPVCQGFSGPCLVCAPCPQMWHVWRRDFLPLQEHSPILWSRLWLIPVNSYSLPSIPFQSRYIHRLNTWSVHLVFPVIHCNWVFIGYNPLPLMQFFCGIAILWIPMNAFLTLYRYMQSAVMLEVWGTDSQSRWPHCALCAATNQQHCVHLRQKRREKKPAMLIFPPFYKYKYSLEQFSRSVLLSGLTDVTIYVKLQK